MARGKKIDIGSRMEKIRTDKHERIKVWKELLGHLEGGYSIDCFSPLSDTMIFEFMKEYPDEFKEVELHETMRKAKAGWEDIGRRQATGNCIGNSRSWFYNMANRYQWSERSQAQIEHKGQVSVSIVNYTQD